MIAARSLGALAPGLGLAATTGLDAQPLPARPPPPGLEGAEEIAPRDAARGFDQPVTVAPPRPHGWRWRVWLHAAAVVKTGSSSGSAMEDFTATLRGSVHWRPLRRAAFYLAAGVLGPTYVVETTSWVAGCHPGVGPRTRNERGGASPVQELGARFLLNERGSVSLGLGAWMAWTQTRAVDRARECDAQGFVLSTSTVGTRESSQVDGGALVEFAAALDAAERVEVNVRLYYPVFGATAAMTAQVGFGVRLW